MAIYDVKSKHVFRNVFHYSGIFVNRQRDIDLYHKILLYIIFIVLA